MKSDVKPLYLKFDATKPDQKNLPYQINKSYDNFKQWLDGVKTSINTISKETLELTRIPEFGEFKKFKAEMIENRRQSTLMKFNWNYLPDEILRSNSWAISTPQIHATDPVPKREWGETPWDDSFDKMIFGVTRSQSKAIVGSHLLFEEEWQNFSLIQHEELVETINSVDNFLSAIKSFGHLVMMATSYSHGYYFKTIVEYIKEEKYLPNITFDIYDLRNYAGHWLIDFDKYYLVMCNYDETEYIVKEDLDVSLHTYDKPIVRRHHQQSNVNVSEDRGFLRILTKTITETRTKDTVFVGYKADNDDFQKFMKSIRSIVQKIYQIRSYCC